MHRIRAFEERAVAALEEGLVLGAIHPSIGQEACAVGTVGSLARDDLLLSTHRGHGHTLEKGASAAAMMRELFGREGGNCGGKGGSMHIADFSVGMLGANGVVGANINIAAGAAHALRLRGERHIVCCIFGDGAINRGPFLEGLNWARVFDLPVLFVCEDNAYAATTRTETMTGGPGPAARAEALGIPAHAVDGNDVDRVAEAATELRERVLAGAGPQFLWAKTWRLTGHTAVDKAAYRDAGEAAARWKDDPIARAAQTLRAHGVGENILSGHREAAVEEMRAAYEEAKAAPWPETAALYADVQDVGDPREAAFRW
ncbi:MAG: thiamine pyrophosphate-dependent dehydrogenase E1 component subunit alpha [Alphaproteobacteria bacterium]|nr:thiamine pyrophosphate-dependent dehydrogenase E1 component subunit alpha [Alphaproteobacteria bacterium]MCY4229387.1 thiamine pyrophosphate-dependent dehydrogenase E1 component subunit alpha [Alphaproteobacteria bacterium]MCY4318729.1 thiamine pyrophosphate-dependent dehydrogenase E1 component subunit alpha [Alphaproteobacteria bacterium]